MLIERVMGKVDGKREQCKMVLSVLSMFEGKSVRGRPRVMMNSVCFYFTVDC